MQNVFPARFRDTEAFLDDLSIRLMTAVSAQKEYVAIRPEHIRIHGNGVQSPKQTANQFKGTISTILNKGFQCNVNIMAGNVQFRSLMTTSDILKKNLKEDDPIMLSFDSAHVHAL